MFKKNKKQTENVKEKKVRIVKVGTHKKTVIVLWVVLIANIIPPIDTIKLTYVSTTV